MILGAGAQVQMSPSSTSDKITLTQGALAIPEALTIQGPGASKLSISGGGASGVFALNGPYPADLTQVVRYLQKEIRHARRNVGALKLSNLLQLDRFEEDLNISRVRLTPEPPPPKSPAALAPTCSPSEQEQGRQHALAQLRDLKEKLR